jgi:hypothetical protein
MRPGLDFWTDTTIELEGNEQPSVIAINRRHLRLSFSPACLRHQIGMKTKSSKNLALLKGGHSANTDLAITSRRDAKGGSLARPMLAATTFTAGFPEPAIYAGATIKPGAQS